MKIFIIQEELDGIVEEPKLFRKEKDADQYYIGLVNENFDKSLKNIKDALEFMADDDIQFDGYFVRYWELEV